MKFGISIFVLIAGLAVALPAQQASESVDVVLVEVPVHVVDRSGAAVKGLTAANFEVLDEGRKRPITHFEAVDLTAVPAKERFSLNPAARRKFLLLFDLTYSSPGTIDRAAEAARHFVRSGLGERDLAGIATFSVEKGFDWIASFTTDRRTLLSAIEGVGTSQLIRAADPLVLSVALQPQGATGPESRHETKEAFDESAAAIERRVTQSNQEIQRARIRLQLDRFAGLARVLDRIRGQKQVILLSEGFDAQLLQGRETSASRDDAADLAASIHGEIWNIDNDQRFGNSAAVNTLERMANVFRRSDVVLHAIDIKGLRSDVDARDGRRPPSTESLYLLSNPTGGELFKNVNDVQENFDRMLRQQQVVYILGFQVPSPGTPGKFHDLKVRLRDVPGGRVSHRAGYYEPSPATSMLESTLSAVEILMNDIPRDEVAVDMLVAPFPAETGNPQIPVILEINGATMLRGAAGKAVDGEVFVYAFDRDYAVRDFLYQKINFDLAKVGDRLASHGVRFYGALNLPPGEYDVKALVRVPQTGRAGFRRTTLQVPDFSKPSLLPPFFVGAEDRWIMVKVPPRRAAEVDYPFTIASQAFVPDVAAALTGDASQELALFGYGLDPEGLQISVMVKDSSGAERPANVTLVGRTPKGAEGATKFLFQFKPAGLPVGEYALNFDVQSKDQPDRYRVSVPFVVR